MALRLPFVIAAALLGAVLLCARAHGQEPLAEVVGVPTGPLADVVRAVVGTADEPATTLFEARRRAQQARGRAIEALESEGYYGWRVDARVEPGDIPQARLEISPGPRFTLGAVRVEVMGQSEGALPAVALSAANLQSGAPARAAEVFAAQARAVAAVQAAGYPDVETLDYIAAVDHDRDQVDVTFRIDSGRAAVFGPVQATGDARLRAEYLMSLAPFEPGDRYDEADLETLATRLRTTGAFESVSAQLAESQGPGVEPETRPVIVDIRQGDRRSLALGASYSTDEGAGVEGEWTLRNVRGGAETLTLSAEYGELTKRLDVELVEPHWRRPDRTLRLTGSAVDEDTDAYDRAALEAGARVEVNRTERLSGSVGTGASLSRVEEGGDSDEFALVYVSAAAAWDASNDLLDPTRGVRLSGSARPTVGYGDDSPLGYVVMDAAASVYQPLGDKVTAAIRARVGTIVGPALSELPANERFFAGGGGSIRGYDYQSVSPRDAAGELEGGRSLVELAAELRYRTEGRLGYVAFVDGGAASEQLAPSADEVRWAAGVGVRYYTRIGPIRADVAFPLDPREDDPGVQLYVSIGQAF